MHIPSIIIICLQLISNILKKIIGDFIIEYFDKYRKLYNKI